MKKSEHTYRIWRGGGWSYDAGYCRSAYRDSWRPGFRVDGLGFRIAKEIKNETA
jgi:formylglycine-generating enzyme required for sulfatase activity